MLPLVQWGWFPVMVERIWPGDLSQDNIMVHIAVAHSTFNVFNTLIFLPIIGFLEKVVMKMLPTSPD